MRLTIYIDADYRCHTTPGDGLTSVETDYFDGKCQAYIDGYRYVPAGASWTRPDGVVFSGEMVSPWKPWRELDAAQRAYEQEQLENLSAQNAEYEKALSEIEAALGVNT